MNFLQFFLQSDLLYLTYKELKQNSLNNNRYLLRIVVPYL